MTTARAPRTYDVKVYVEYGVPLQWVGGCRGCGAAVIVNLGAEAACPCGDTTRYTIAEKPKKDR